MHPPSKKLFQEKPSLAAEYIGNKRGLLDFVTGPIMAVAAGRPDKIVDLFSGTGSVSAAFKKLGFSVTANDHLSTCFNLTSAVLLNHECPTFPEIFSRADRASATSKYESVLEHLNNIPLRSGGFIHEKYSPASFETDRVERRYFTEVNAARIDTIRDEIELLRTRLTLAEHALLISDLLRAASSVANIAGTYGSYLKDWKSKALATIQLRPAQFTDGQREGHQVWSLDAVEAGARARADIVYADPPYTKRQYAAYYHVLETIALNDRPVLTGSTGLREWQTHSSDFCYKQKAPRALQQLVESLSCRHFFLSYNDDGQIPHDVILQILGGYGGVIFREKVIRRYKSSRQSHKGPGVVERLYHLSIQ